MAQVQARRPRGGECQGHQVVQPDGGDGDAERRLVAPADASGQAAHGGGPVVEVDDAYDSKVKIGEALEAAARAVGDQPVRGSDAAAIRAAEARAGAGAGVVPGGVAEQAQAAADANAGAPPPAEDKVITIGDVLAWNATATLSTEKAVTAEDAAAAAEAEVEKDPGEGARPYGVSAALTAAAKYNREDAECQSKRSTRPRAADECTPALVEQFDRI
uniref:SMP domain-containing protein n=1 Tax=Oryza meridionalis TaxID=40149 RepID=A0A0E0D6S6_9ORYZ